MSVSLRVPPGRAWFAVRIVIVPLQQFLILRPSVIVQEMIAYLIVVGIGTKGWWITSFCDLGV